MRYFITAIDTDSGKSLVSAILIKALKGDYWKPVQAGTPTDTNYVKALVQNSGSTFFKEAYMLQTPCSPHAAAEKENIQINTAEMDIPQTSNPLIIEGAGGALAPLNDEEFAIDIAKRTQAEVVLVSNLYLGSINHTLLTVEYLKQRNYKVKGIIFNGEPNPESESFILKYSGYPCLLRILPEEKINEDIVNHYAEKLAENW
ncbi:dethiobiotin synthase [Xanthovirga aplysinae]|uniref:dethiobiotin synthase n=1 Tax=Xanthovirga aplysinae TaxID=2529853 RepID=UPI0012BC3114|nr:dethiobiotin synthase [Xanthovirga aplysinae]MTI31013.1 dethiobiotin synthase [Xanthovirga aplysinae]